MYQAAQFEDVESETYTFAQNYRTTLHSSTGIAPAAALFGWNIKTKVLQVWPELSDNMIRDRDKVKMKTYAERRQNIHNCEMKHSQQVLLKSTKSSKLEPVYQKDLYVVIEQKGPMIIAQRGNEVKTRNISHVVQVRTRDDPRQVETPEPDESKVSQSIVQQVETSVLEFVTQDSHYEITPEVVVTLRRSVRSRQPPRYLNDYVKWSMLLCEMVIEFYSIL